MAIDFNNKADQSPRDPSAVVAVRPARKRGWIETTAQGEWTGKFSASKPNPATNWREVGYATVLTNDGREFLAVLDESGQPISVIGDEVGTNDDQARRFKEQQASANRPPEERNNNGRRERWNPQTSKWDDIGPAINPSASTAESAAKPPETKDEGGKRWQWKPNAGGPNAGGEWVAVGDAPLTPAERQAQEANQPTVTTKVEVRGGKTYTVQTIVPKPGQPGQPRIQVYDPDGNIVHGGLPPEPGKEDRTLIQRNGKVYIQVKRTDPATGQTSLTFETQDGTPTTLPDEKDPNAVGTLPADFPRYTPDLTKPGAGIHDYQRAVDDWMAANPGKMTFENRQKVLASANEQAKTIVGEWNTAAGILKEQYQQEVSQRSQDITQAGNRLASADRGLAMANGMIEKFAPYLGANPGDASKLYQGQLAAQIIQAGVMGGLDTPGRVELDPRLGAFVDRTLGPAGGAAGAAGGGMPAPGTPANALGLGAGFGTPAPTAIGPTKPGAPLPYAPGTTPIVPPVDPATAEAQRQAAQAQQAGIATTGQPTAGEPGGPPLVPAAGAPAGPNPGAGIAPPPINPVTGEPTGLAPLPNTPAAATSPYQPTNMIVISRNSDGARSAIGRAEWEAVPQATRDQFTVENEMSREDYDRAYPSAPPAAAPAAAGPTPPAYTPGDPNEIVFGWDAATNMPWQGIRGNAPPSVVIQTDPGQMTPGAVTMAPGGDPGLMMRVKPGDASTGAPPDLSDGTPLPSEAPGTDLPPWMDPADWIVDANGGPPIRRRNAGTRPAAPGTVNTELQVTHGTDVAPYPPAPPAAGPLQTVYGPGQTGFSGIGPPAMDVGAGLGAGAVDAARGAGLLPKVSQGNPAAERLFGKSLPESFGDSWQDNAVGMAMKQAPRQPSPTAERLFGRGLPQPAASRIQGITPEIDDIARRELMAEEGILV